MISKNPKQPVPRHDTIEIRLQIDIITTDRSDRNGESTLSVRQESTGRENTWNNRRRINF